MLGVKFARALGSPARLFLYEMLEEVRRMRSISAADGVTLPVA